MEWRFGIFVVGAVALLFAANAPVMAQVAGGTTVGVSVKVNEALAAGWSARRTILGHKVVGDANKVVGSVADIIVDPEKTVSTIILRVGSSLPSSGN